MFRQLHRLPTDRFWSHYNLSHRPYSLSGINKSTRLFLQDNNGARPFLCERSLAFQAAEGIWSVRSKSMSVGAIDNDNDVFFATTQESVGIATLNRPKFLNVLNLSMVNKLYSTLKRWESEKCAVILKGNGRAFCAGGDLKIMYLEATPKNRCLERIINTYYRTLDLIEAYAIPYVALVDGTVMGAGAGLAVNGQFSVVTEKCAFAMPETTVGLVPAIGASHFLTRSKLAKLGYFLGLTGHQLRGYDVVRVGIATHFCESSRLQDLERELAKCRDESEIRATLEKYCTIKKPSWNVSLEPHLEKIETYFSCPTVEGIVAYLEKDRSEWAQKTLNLLLKASPKSLKLTLRQFDLGAKMDLRESLLLDYRLTRRLIESDDVFEGVRTILIEKGKNPSWNPKTIEEVSDEMINNYFDKIMENNEPNYRI